MHRLKRIIIYKRKKIIENILIIKMNLFFLFTFYDIIYNIFLFTVKIVTKIIFNDLIKKKSNEFIKVKVNLNFGVLKELKNICYKHNQKVAQLIK